MAEKIQFSKGKLLVSCQDDNGKNEIDIHKSFVKCSLGSYVNH